MTFLAGFFAQVEVLERHLTPIYQVMFANKIGEELF